MKNKEVVLMSKVFKDYKVRTAREDDLEFLRTCKNSNRESFFFKEIISSKMQKKWFADYQKRDHDFMLIVEHEKERAGCIGFRRLADRVDLYNIIIGEKEKAGKGYMATALDLVCEEAWRRYPGTPIMASVLRKNPALNWYLRRGFAVTAEHEEYFELTREKKMISVFGSLVGDEEIANAVNCMKRQWMGFGDNVMKFEQAFSKKFNIPHFAMVDSGSNALFMAASLLNLPRGSEIIVPSFGWVSCAQAVLMAGHKPIFCDVDPVTMNIRREDIGPFLKSGVKAIMVIHYAGLAVDLDPITALGLPVIEDAAHAVCSTYKGKPCGAIADVGIYSFDAIKNLTTGEGGGLASRHAAWIERAKTLRYCGIGKSGFEAALANAKGKSRWWEYNISEPFIKMLPTNIAAGIGLAQLDRIDALQAIRRDIWRYYQNEFGRMDWIITPAEARSGDKHSYFTYCIRVPNRDKLAHFLLEKEVYTTLRYHPLHMNPLYRQMNVRLPHCEALNEDALNIPLHPRLSSNDVNKIVDLIREFGKINSL